MQGVAESQHPLPQGAWPAGQQPPPGLTLPVGPAEAGGGERGA
jgi:hypothetical protein